MTITKERLMELFDIDMANGELTRKKSTGSRPVGEVAGTVRPDGYIQIRIDNKTYLAHRVLLFLREGQWPECVDHVNGIKDDNRSENIRSVCHRINSRNVGIGKGNKTGVMGVRFRKSRNSYEAYWLDEEGKTRYKNFSCDNYGSDGAKKMAAKHRESMIQRMNDMGGGYSDSHGLRAAYQ